MIVEAIRYWSFAGKLAFVENQPADWQGEA